MTQTQAQPEKKTTATDSFLGMALVMSFLGAAYGPDVETASKAVEMADDVYQDRRPAPANDFKLGAKKSLSGNFTNMAEGLDLTKTWEPFFKPVPSPTFAPAWAR